MKPEIEKRVLELAGLLCDEAINKEQFAELDAILAEEPAARLIYQDFLAMHKKLSSGVLEDGKAKENVIPIHKNQSLLWVASAAVVITSLFAILLLRTDSQQTAASEKPIPIAVLTRAIDVTWEHKTRFQADPGDALEPGWLRLKSGIAEISFSSGATVSLEGPARLRVDSPMHCVTKWGKLAANCPESAYGFTIRFPGGRVIDKGTEFALNTEPEGKTEVHVFEGEVLVEQTDEDERVLKEASLLESNSVTLGPDSRIEEIEYTDQPFVDLKRKNLIRSQPVKLQFDLGHRAGVYTGTNSPGHAGGDFYQHENAWNQIVGDQSGTFLLADGNLCPYPIQVDYGHGDGTIDWDAQPVDPWGKVYRKAKGIFNTELAQDHRPWDFDLGLRISGLPAGKYRIYALCRSVRRPEASYDVSFGTNLDRQLEQPVIIPTMDKTKNPAWVDGETFALGEVEISGPEDWATFITRYSRQRSIQSSPLFGRSVLLGLQIVEVR